MSATPVISVAECLTEVLGMAVAEHPELATKLRKAAHVIDANMERHVFPNDAERGDYFVESECQPGQMYSVNIVTAACTCLDFQNRGGPCKHVLAVRMLKAASYLRNAQQRALDYGMDGPPDTARQVARLVAVA